MALLDRTDYLGKMTSILTDQKRFKVERVQKNRVARLQKIVSDEVELLRSGPHLTDGEAYRLKNSGSYVPRLYGVAKVHKQECPLRPILSMVGSPVHHLAQWLAKVLEPVRRKVCKYSIKDSATLGTGRGFLPTFL